MTVVGIWCMWYSIDVFLCDAPSLVIVLVIIYALSSSTIFSAGPLVPGARCTKKNVLIEISIVEEIVPIVTLNACNSDSGKLPL